MDTLKILKRLVSEGYSLKSHHNNTKWKDALEEGELLIQELSKLRQGAVSGSFPYPVHVDGDYIEVTFKKGMYYIKQIKECEQTYHNTSIDGKCEICSRVIRK